MVDFFGGTFVPLFIVSGSGQSFVPSQQGTMFLRLSVFPSVSRVAEELLRMAQLSVRSRVGLFFFFCCEPIFEPFYLVAE